MEAPPKQLSMQFPGFLIQSIDGISSKRRALFQFLVAHHPSTSESDDLQATVTTNVKILARVCDETLQEAKRELPRQDLFNAISSKLSTMYTYWIHKPVHVSDLQQLILKLCASRDHFLNTTRRGLIEPYEDDLTKNIDSILARLNQGPSMPRSICPTDRKRPLDSESPPVSKKCRVATECSTPFTNKGEQLPDRINIHTAELLEQVKVQQDEIKVYQDRVAALQQELKDYRQVMVNLSAAQNDKKDKLVTLGTRLWTKVSEAANKESAQGISGGFGDSIDEVERFLGKDIRILVTNGEVHCGADEDKEDNASSASFPGDSSLPYRPADTPMSS